MYWLLYVYLALINKLFEKANGVVHVPKIMQTFVLNESHFFFLKSFLYGFYLLFTKWPGFIFHFKHLPPIPPLAQAVVSTGLPLHSRRLLHERNPRRDLKKTKNKTKTLPSHFSHRSNSLQGKKADRVY